jgi:phosphoribosyl 1,2-cyclic phosphodiesterase
MSNPPTSGLTVHFRGVRGSLPSPGEETARYGGNTSCVEVRAGDEILILDAGSGLRELGRDLVKEFGSRSIKASVLISHTHWDHIQGLPFFAPGFSEGNEIRVLAAPGRKANLELALHRQMEPLNFPVGFSAMRGLSPIEEMSSPSATVGSFIIRATNLNHPGGCAGFRVESNGASLAYLPDHEPFSTVGANSSAARAKSEALIDFVRGVDFLILDTQYTAAEYPSRVGWGHGRLPDSIVLAVEAGVRQLALFHHDPAHDDDQIDAMVAEGKRLAGSSSLLVIGASENSKHSLAGRVERVASVAA